MVKKSYVVGLLQNLIACYTMELQIEFTREQARQAVENLKEPKKSGRMRSKSRRNDSANAGHCGDEQLRK